MKRRWIVGGVVAVVLLVLAVPAVGLGSAFVGLEPLVARTFADGRVETIVDGYVSCYLVNAGEGRFVLIDGCNDTTGAPVLAALERNGVGVDALDAVLLTHAHPDHTGFLQGHRDLPVIALADEVPQLDGTGAFRGPLLLLMGAPPDLGLTGLRGVRDGEQLTFGDASVQVYAAPGHTRGSAVYLVDGVLILGDSAAWKPPKLVGAPWIFSDDCDENVASMRALAERLKGQTVDWLAPAHSGAVAGLDALAAL